MMHELSAIEVSINDMICQLAILYLSTQHALLSVFSLDSGSKFHVINEEKDILDTAEAGVLWHHLQPVDYQL